MRLFGKVDGKIEHADRAAWLTPPFDRSFVRSFQWNSTTNQIPALTPPSITLSAPVSTGSAMITISCDVQGATIRYTLNGKNMTTNFSSPIYTGPITVYETSVIRANWYFHGLKSLHAKAVAIVVR